MAKFDVKIAHGLKECGEVEVGGDRFTYVIERFAKTGEVANIVVRSAISYALVANYDGLAGLWWKLPTGRNATAAAILLERRCKRMARRPDEPAEIKRCTGVRFDRSGPFDRFILLVD